MRITVVKLAIFAAPTVAVLVALGLANKIIIALVAAVWVAAWVGYFMWAAGRPARGYQSTADVGRRHGKGDQP
jgi:hypothetical protein